MREPIDYYPSDFKLDKYESLSYNKRAIIPFLDEDKVRKVYSQIDKSTFSEAEKLRNTLNFKTQYFHQNQKELIQFKANENLEAELKRIFLKKKLRFTRKRFPTSDLFGQFILNEKSKIEINRKYHDTGNPTELVFFNNFIDYIEDKVKCTEEIKPDI